jgi:hypothetical protein
MLAQAEGIAQAISRAGEQLSKAEKVFIEARKAHNSAVAEEQERCQHWATRYYPDASGNNDSETRCLICGKDEK